MLLTGVTNDETCVDDTAATYTQSSLNGNYETTDLAGSTPGHVTGIFHLGTPGSYADPGLRVYHRASDNQEVFIYAMSVGISCAFAFDCFDEVISHRIYADRLRLSCNVFLDGELFTTGLYGEAMNQLTPHPCFDPTEPYCGKTVEIAGPGVTGFDCIMFGPFTNATAQIEALA